MRHSIMLCALMALTFTASPSLLAQHSCSYTVDRLDGDVYYGNVFVRGADASTFVDLGYGYGKDRYHVYRFGEVLEYVDPSSFRVSSEFASDEAYGHMRPGYGGDCCHDGYGQYDNGGYYKTSFDVFFRGREISDAHVSSFEVLGDGYAKDSFNVYWNGRVMDDAHAMSFESLGWGYAKDPFHVFWRGEILDGAMPSSFKVSRDGYAKDAFNTYFHGRKVRR